MNSIQIFSEKLKKSPLVLFLWYVNGKKIPPPHIYKQKIVSEYGKTFKINVLYESGTFKGDMVYGMKNRFQKIFSVELSDFYFQIAKKRFNNDKHISIIKGDSEREIQRYLNSLKEPSVFWLDGHYSGGHTTKSKVNTPIINELKSILNHKIKTHVILIDDARHFIGEDGYPKINDLKKMLKGSNYGMKIKDDIIRITSQNY